MADICEDWLAKYDADGCPTTPCTAVATRSFTWWPNDPEKIVTSFLCKRHANMAQRTASKARIPFHNVPHPATPTPEG